MKIKTFSLSLISLALLNQSAFSADFVNYTGPNKNPTRTVEETLKIQELYRNKDKNLGKDHYRYPENSYYAVVYSSDTNMPSESVIRLWSYPYHKQTPQKLNIENYHFTLDKAFPSSSLLELHSDVEAKYTNGKVTLGDNIEIPNFEDEFGITTFDLENKAKLTLNNVDVEGLNLKTPLSVAELYKSKLDVNNSTINLTGDNNKFTFDLESSEVNINKLNMNIAGNGRFNIGFFTSNTDLTVKDSHLSIESNQQHSSALLGSNDSDVNIENSQLIAKDKSVVFANLEDDYDDTLNREQNTFNLKNTSALSDDALIMLHKKPLYPEGDEDRFVTSKRFVFNVENSTLSGRTVQLDEPIPLILNLSKNSKWSVTGNSEVTELNNQDSNVSFEKGNFHILTLDELKGNGQFSLRTDLANEKSDQIHIKNKAEGKHLLAIRDSGNEPNAENGKVTLVKTNGNGDAVFSLKDKDYVDAGAYRYRLEKDQTNWILTSKTKPVEQPKTVEQPKPAEQPKSAEQSKPVKQPKPVQPSTLVEANKSTGTAKPIAVVPPTPPKATEQPKPAEPANPAKPIEPTPAQTTQLALSETTNALVSLRQAQLVQLEQSLAGIHQRLGELKQGEKGNVWVRNLNSRNEFDSTATANNSQTSGFEQNYHGVQLGADVAISDNVRLGGFVGTGRSQLDFNGEYDTAKLAEQSLGLYGTYQHENGVYLDNIVKFSRFNAKTQDENQRYNAYTLSSELGRVYSLASWSITPNAQLAWSRIAGGNNVQATSALYTKVGARVAKNVDLGGWKLQPYAELNGIHSKANRSQVNVNQHAFNVASAGGRVETALGVNALFGNHRIGLEAKTTHGSRLSQPFTAQAIYRYQW